MPVITEQALWQNDIKYQYSNINKVFAGITFTIPPSSI